MIVPFQVQIANQLLLSTKYTHDHAITLLTHCTEYLFQINTPSELRHIAFDMLGFCVMSGDRIGNAILHMYVFLISNI